MSFLGKLFSPGASRFMDAAGGLVDRFVVTGDDKNKFKLELETLLQVRDSELESTMRTELGAKERIMVAELQQDDLYTKRARPTVVYGGLAMIFVNYVFVPMVSKISGSEAIEAFPMPQEFWYAWGGVVGAYSLGRSMEKRGSASNLLSLVTGSKKPASLLD